MAAQLASSTTYLPTARPSACRSQQSAQPPALRAISAQDLRPGGRLAVSLAASPVSARLGCIRSPGARHVTCAKAAADGWWHDQEQHWTFVHSDKEFQDVLANANNLVLVDCFTPWCGGCKLIYPQLCRLAMDDQLKKQCTFVKVDTDEMSDWAGRENVKTLPYMTFYRAGEGKLLGMQMDGSRVKLLRNAIATLADNRGKTFRLDPNGYVVANEPAGLAT